MKTYNISFKYSKDGKGWNGMTVSVKAESDYSAIKQVESRYPFVKDIKILSVR
ncbi:hypothetical protein [Brachyspira innocens]|uniref:hypothetical protein n=1 Tax=Brachyspira innocens TaxID=13264 RepID=UPI00035C32C3|nr:hypothetical protein [Brachyspira innocens]